MERKFDISRYLTGYIAALFYGVIMACFYGSLAKVMIAMLALLWVLMQLQETLVVQACRTLLLFVIAVTSVAGWTVNSPLNASGADPLLPLVFFGYLYFVEAKEFREPEPAPSPFHWPKKFSVAFALYGFIAFWFTVHTFFNLFLGKMVPQGKLNPDMLWSKVFLAVMVFGLGYPPRLVIPWTDWQRKALQVGIPIAILVIPQINWRYSQSIEKQARITHYWAYGAQEAFRYGFHDLGIKLALDETLRKMDREGWPEANQYLRGQWTNASKEALAKQWRKHPKAQNNLFFFATCFGAALQLKPGEEAVDWIVDSEKQSIRILTSHGRILLIDKQGITQMPGNELGVTSFAYYSLNLRVAVNNGHLELGGEKIGRKILLPQDREWIDVSFRPDGSAVLILDTHGRIVEMKVPTNETEWMSDIQPHEIFPPLWGEQALAQSLLVLEDGTVLMADKVGAVHVRSGNSRWDAKELTQHYHPERPVMRDLAIGRNSDELMLLDQSGWVYFIGSDTPTMQALFDSDEAVDLAALSQVNCLLQLKRSGRIVPYVMPQGAPVIFHGKGNRIDTE